MFGRPKVQLLIPAPTTFKKPGGSNVRVPGGAYSDRIARKICQYIMEGGTLKTITAKPTMPSKRTIIRWLSDPNHVEFREQYYYAKRIQAELLVDEMLEISDDSAGDWIKSFNKKGEFVGYKPDNEAIQRSRLRVDTRKFLAMKLLPKIYGDHVDVTHGVSGELAELLKSASNCDTGLPAPIDGKVKKIE